MDILIHDYSGHPFQAELSRELAARGHFVTHAYFSGDSGPKGRLHRTNGDAESLAFLPLGGEIAYSKTNFLRRRAGDIQYGRALADHIHSTLPDIVISGNAPTESQEFIISACTSNNIPFVFWCQDIFSIAASRILGKKLPGLGHLIGAYYEFLERRQMRRADEVLLITEAFLSQTDAWNISRDKVSIIPNWGALDEISVLDRDTSWAREQGISSSFRFMYSGTLALKHNPAILENLANALEEDQEVVLVSHGVGVDELVKGIESGDIHNLRILPLQPFDLFSEVLASGDVLLAVIERDAGTFSVPSKILSYLCAGRPIVLSAPKENLAARILIETGAGKVVDPDDVTGFIDAAMSYYDNRDAAASAGRAGREYAEENFILEMVANRFLEVCAKAMSNKTGEAQREIF